MKQFIIRNIIVLILSLPVLTALGQNQDNVPYVYGYDVDFVSSVPTADNVYQIQLYSLSDELTIRKKSDIGKDSLEKIIYSLIPDAQIQWNNRPTDLCSVISEKGNLDNVVEKIMKEEAVSFVSTKYIRKTYKDLIDIYPVSQVATYGYTGELYFVYISNEAVNEANELINSCGLEIYYQSGNSGGAIVPKSLDIISTANRLQESGLFLLVTPSKIISKRVLTNPLIDKATLPFYYDDNGEKEYWYEIADRFIVRKTADIDKTVLEALINRNVDESEIIWENDSICTVLTHPQNVDAAMNAIIQDNSVLHVSHKYLNVNSYEKTIGDGLKNPESFGLNGKISVSFKDDITETEKNNLINSYNLNAVYSLDFSNYWEYEVPKTADALTISNNISETGLVKNCMPMTTQVYKLILEPHTDISNITNAYEISTQYYNLVGNMMETPSGLTIVVTRYSDGSVKTEKKLFK